MKYRYNIGTHIKGDKVTMDKFERLYYRSDHYDKLIDKILTDRDDKRIRYGEKMYASYMDDNIKKHEKDSGFWKNAHLVGGEREGK